MTAAEKAKGAARKAAAGVIGRVRDQTAEALRPELDAAHAEIAALRTELESTRADLRADIELLWAEREARKH